MTASVATMWINRLLWGLCALNFMFGLMLFAKGDAIGVAIAFSGSAFSAFSALIAPNHVRMPR